MEDAAATARQRLARWIEDSREVFALLPELLDGVQKASAKAEHAEREAERLRRELMGLRKELTEARDKETGGRAQHGELEKQLEELKRLGCHRAQGYLLASPMNAAAVAKLLAQQLRAHVPGR